MHLRRLTLVRDADDGAIAVEVDRVDNCGSFVACRQLNSMRADGINFVARIQARISIVFFYFNGGFLPIIQLFNLSILTLQKGQLTASSTGVDRGNTFHGWLK